MATSIDTSERARARDDEDAQDLLGRVGGRADGVRAEDGEGLAFLDRRSPISSSLDSGRPKNDRAAASDEARRRGGERDVGGRLGDQLTPGPVYRKYGACGRSTRTRRSPGLRPLERPTASDHWTPIDCDATTACW